MVIKIRTENPEAIFLDGDCIWRVRNIIERNNWEDRYEFIEDINENLQLRDKKKKKIFIGNYNDYLVITKNYMTFMDAEVFKEIFTNAKTKDPIPDEKPFNPNNVTW